MSIQAITNKRRCRVYVTALDRAGSPLNLIWEGSASTPSDAVEQAKTVGRDYGFIDLIITEIKVKPQQNEGRLDA